MPALPSAKSPSCLATSSTPRLLQHLGDRYADVLAGTNACCVDVPGGDGHEIDTAGDGFSSPSNAPRTPWRRLWQRSAPSPSIPGQRVHQCVRVWACIR